MMDFLTWSQWALLVLGAVSIGLSKTAVPGMGVLAVALFALVLPIRESVGVVLPVLIAGDVIAVASYRRSAVWSHLLALFPWAAVGIVIGYLAMGRINDRQVAHLIGAVLVVLVPLQLWRRWESSRTRSGAAPEARTSRGNGTGAEAEPARGIESARSAGAARGIEPAGDAGAEGPAPFAGVNHWLAASLGITAGFTTMVANAAGPIMIFYLLAMRLPKMEFIGTAAWYFLVLNLFKVPFSLSLGLINPHSLPLDCWLAPAAVLGALSGRALLRFIPQQHFELAALLFTLAAGVRLLV